VLTPATPRGTKGSNPVKKHQRTKDEIDSQGASDQSIDCENYNTNAGRESPKFAQPV
jgi:hypothetical protein